MTAPSGEEAQSGSPIYNMQDRFDVPINLPQFSPEELLGLTFRDMTDLPREALYSGVASLWSLHIVCLHAELNGLKLTGGDVGNAYLEADASEKVCVCAGPEFGPLKGHLLLIEKALYGLLLLVQDFTQSLLILCKPWDLCLLMPTLMCGYMMLVMCASMRWSTSTTY